MALTPLPGVISRVNPTTPDGRYFVVKEQLWRCSNPSLSEDVRQQLVDELMAARRAVKNAKAGADDAALKTARAAVNKAKVALGERGEVWWTDGAADFNRRKVENTPYAQWYEGLARQ
ncbi:hypothetical protein ALQ08_03682 [Pseudomonas syringae pv. delphinii]|uniref:Uncharacterized protein n=1 Tax=Pseudomonas syringae pv. delphinii TaxID=192088 RepID=A0A0P9RGG5_9PSED|nr:Uncharacterized protein ALO72_02752 [Pseudomonas syringae pv. delphinii]RMP09788.1 hypothetical protein ALQ28_01496 [Pseudomonas syringae pv. delphinii]RMQ17620.1 hypothetical protein ALQ08_03682 [Pseudomonas syringae pv. delphinii]